MACVDVLSDDDDEPMAPASVAPAMAPAAVAPAEAESAPAAAVTPVAGGPSTVPAAAGAGSVDILSDDDDEDEPAAPQPSSEIAENLPVTGGASPAEPQRSAAIASPAEEIAQQPQLAPEASALPPAKGLRSVVVAEVDLEDSEDESIKPPPQVKQPAEIEKTQQSGQAGGILEDDDDEDCALGTLTGAAVQVAKAAEEPADVPPPAKKAKTVKETKKVKEDSAAEPASKKAKEVTPTATAEGNSSLVGSAKKTANKDTKDVKEKKLTKDEMESRVLEYMQQQNRPYNAQNVFDNLHGAVPKGQVQLILDALSLSGKLAVKEYGKAKVYLPAQVGSTQSVEEEVKALQCDIDSVKSRAEACKAAVDEARRLLAALRDRRNLAADAANVAREVPELEQKLANLRAAAEESGSKQDAEIDEAEISRLEAAGQRAHGEWRRRKRLCMEILYSFSEMSGAKATQLVDKYGVDTDEACDQIFPEAFAR